MDKNRSPSTGILHQKAVFLLVLAWGKLQFQLTWKTHLEIRAATRHLEYDPIALCFFITLLQILYFHFSSKPI